MKDYWNHFAHRVIYDSHLRIIAAVLVLPLIGGCPLSGDESDEANAILGEWRMVSVQDADGNLVARAPENEHYEIHFLHDGAVTGRNNCNACSGTFDDDGDGAIDIRLHCTEVGCESHSFRRFDELVVAAHRYRFAGHKLHLTSRNTDDDDDIVIVFERKR